MVRFKPPSGDTVFQLVTELLRPDREERGWIKPDDLAVTLGVSRATCYRWLAKLETAGFPLQRDGRHGGSRGVRSLLVGRSRTADLS